MTKVSIVPIEYKWNLLFVWLTWGANHQWGEKIVARKRSFTHQWGVNNSPPARGV